MVTLGEFKCKSGKLVVSDPCYPLGTWCQAEINNVKKGIWLAFVKRINDEGVWGERCAELIAHHKDHNLPENGWEHISGDIGVDSGQAGIFDYNMYRNDNAIEKIWCHYFDAEKRPGDKDKWYEVCCMLTLSRLDAGVLKGGAVSSSGFGGWEQFLFF
ncbi:hypothetical protein SDD30_13195 [Moorella naiadis]|uniref:hypothetical protein n=1 Tax=Moorella naiadis (nom. illeg.) TaxID=3093670 RepID=UPI003D9CAD88